MRTLTYFVATTIDGFIAGPDNEVNFYSTTPDVLDVLRTDFPETLPVQARAALGVADAPNRRFDTMVMGRGTYQPALDAGIRSPYPQLRQVVFSRTLPNSADPELTITDSDPVEYVRALKSEDGLGIYLAGGAVLAAALSAEIDELIVKQYPVVAGAGLSMFDGPFAPTSFTLVDQRALPSGMVILTYRRDDSASGAGGSAT